MGASATLNPYLNALAQSSNLNLLHGQSMPYIRGTWYFVDPYAGSNSNDGLSVGTAVADIQTAYGLCTDLVGDGIMVLSAGSTSAQTTSYLKSAIAWAKNGITVFGVNSETAIDQRSRIASIADIVTGPVTTISQQANSITRTSGSFLTDGWVAGMKGYTADSGSNNGSTFTITVATALILTISETFNVQSAGAVGSCTMTSYIPALVTVSGANNRFYNLQFWNAGTQVGALGGVIVTGVRNHFVNCQFAGGTGCTATANERSLELGTGAIANTFDSCTIGEDTTNRGNNANCELYLNGTTAADGRNFFRRCHFLSYADGGVAHLAIKSAAATSVGRNTIFEDCFFENYRPNLGADQTTMFGGTGLTTAKLILTGKTVICGYALADSSTTNKCVFVGTVSPTANGAGAIATTKSS